MNPSPTAIDIISSVFVFIIYALVIWYFCGKHRRRWRGLMYAMLAAAGIALVYALHWKLAGFFGKQMYFGVMSHILVPYGAFVSLMGFLIVSFPRKRTPDLCQACGYDLAGHEIVEPLCPECGTLHVVADGAKTRRAGDGGGVRLANVALDGSVDLATTGQEAESAPKPRPAFVVPAARVRHTPKR